MRMVLLPSLDLLQMMLLDICVPHFFIVFMKFKTQCHANVPWASLLLIGLASLLFGQFLISQDISAHENAVKQLLLKGQLPASTSVWCATLLHHSRKCVHSDCFIVHPLTRFAL